MDVTEGLTPTSDLGDLLIATVNNRPSFAHTTVELKEGQQVTHHTTAPQPQQREGKGGRRITAAGQGKAGPSVTLREGTEGENGSMHVLV